MRSPQMRHDRRGEARLPAVVAVLVAIALYTVLPSTLVVEPHFVVPVLGLLLLGPLIVFNPVRMTRQTRVSRTLSLILVGLIGVANTSVLVLLVHKLLDGKASNGRQLLLAAL